MPNGEDGRWYWEVIKDGREVVVRGVTDTEPAACEQAHEGEALTEFLKSGGWHSLAIRGRKGGSFFRAPLVGSKGDQYEAVACSACGRVLCVPAIDRCDFVASDLPRVLRLSWRAVRNHRQLRTSCA
jgi:hypothetical protein